MQKYLSLLLVSLFLALNPVHAQGVIVKNIGEEIIAIFTKKGAKELAQAGGKEGVEQSLQYIAKEGGETALERARMYSKIYGSPALNAIKTSPKKVTQALDSIPTEYKSNLITIVNKNPSAIAKRLDKEGIDFLKLEAKYPSIGNHISQLGPEASQIAFDLSKKEATLLARSAPCLEAAKKVAPDQYSGFLAALKKAPAKTIECLERNPKVLFTGAALTAFVSAKEDLLKEGGLVEEAVTKPLSFFAYSVALLALLFLGIKFNPLKK